MRNAFTYILCTLSLLLTHFSYAENGFVDNQQCLHCHKKESELWKKSDHFQSMQYANVATVLADFDKTSFIIDDQKWHFDIRDGKYFVNAADARGVYRDFEVKYTFGYKPLQQYLVDMGEGKYQALIVAWDSRPKKEGGQRWFYLTPDQVLGAGSALHWTGRGYNWNNRCADCHSTNFQKKYLEKSKHYNSQFSEINVSCQSCHGPGKKHIEWSKSKNKHLFESLGLVVNYKDKTDKRILNTCARCHSRRKQLTATSYQHQKSFLSQYQPELITEGLYHYDGQIDDEVFVYGSFVQSKMYQHDVTCIDCHNPHSGKIKLEGNKLCLQCHKLSPPTQKFSSLKSKNYDDPTHHFHKKDSAGAQCVNCHMPEKNYMVVDPRRDHSFKIPMPMLSKKIGSPNVCATCHQDKSTQWAQQILESQFTKKNIKDYSGYILSEAAKGSKGALKPLIELIYSEKTSAFTKASAFTFLSHYYPNKHALNVTIKGLSDKNELIRQAAVKGLAEIPLKYTTPLLITALADDNISVRFTAFSQLLPKFKYLTGESLLLFKQTLQNYKKLQSVNLDTVEALLNLGQIASIEKKWLVAESYFNKAFDMSPDFIPTVTFLAQHYVERNLIDKAIFSYQQAIEKAPDIGDYYFQLAMLLKNHPNVSDKEYRLTLLRKSSEILNERPNVLYQYALILYQAKHYEQSLSILMRAHSLAENDEKIKQLLLKVRNNLTSKK